MTTQQHYVAGSHVPGFFVGQDFYPNPDAPDDTSLASVSQLKNIQFKLLKDGDPITVIGTVVTRTVKLPNDSVPTVHQGILVAAVNMARSLTRANKQWFWRFEVDLAGDGLPVYSEWQEFTVW